MTTEQLLIKRLIAAGDKIPNKESYDEYIKDPVQKEWADAYHAIRDYSLTIIEVDNKFENIIKMHEKLR